MTLVFFKAMRPYDKTTGIFENYYWYKGVCGPISIKEAQRLNAAMGGRIETIELPHIKSLEDFLVALGAKDFTIFNREDKGKTLSEIAGPLKGNNDPQEIIKKHLMHTTPSTSSKDSHDVDERPDRIHERKDIPVEVIMSMEKNALETLAHAEDINVPAYAIQFKELTDAKAENNFDYIEFIGSERNGLSILRAYMLMKLSK